MKRSISYSAFCLMALAPILGAHEYALQFTPNPGYRGLVLAGYTFDKDGTEVVGNCSYYTVSSSGGKGGGKTTTKSYLQTCRWDLSGNLVSVTPGAPAIPLPLQVNGTQIVFAVNAKGDTTGSDLALAQGGFVNSPGADYSWVTPQNHGALHSMVYSINAVLKSDGDEPLEISAVTPSALQGIVTLTGTTCIGEVKPGDTCSITVSYDPTRLTAPLGVAVDTLRIDLTSNAGAGHDFIQVFSVLVPRRF